MRCNLDWINDNLTGKVINIKHFSQDFHFEISSSS